MKRIINTLIITSALALAFSCQEKEGLEVYGNESIVLDISSARTRALGATTEDFVKHLDIFIFTKDGSQTKHYSRYNVNNTSRITINQARSSFDTNVEYKVYIIANSTYSQDTFAQIKNYNSLVLLKQEDMNLHLSGIAADNVPGYFLMDAVAKDAEGKSEIVINNGNPSDNTVLSAALKRAAAKVVINIEAGDKVEFRSFPDVKTSEGGVYYVRNLPFEAYLLAEAKETSSIYAKVRNTTKSNSEYLVWDPSKDNKNVSLVTYVYPNHWEDDSILEQETCVVLNLPLTFTPKENESIDYHNSWYKIPMTDDQSFERNNYYEINISLNRPGAIEESTPEEINDITYSVEEWVEVTVNVDGENRPDYLQLNTSHVDIYNLNSDSSTLKFASSSPIPANGIALLEAYYYNYLDQKVDLSKNDEYNVYKSINAVAEQNVLNGGITINSPFVTDRELHGNATRYLRFRVVNTSGQQAEFTVAQYPTLYITNELGYYSYRDDFGGTNYLKKGNPNYSGVDWDNGKWKYNSQSSGSVFFGSKVRVGGAKNDGTYRIDYTYWNGSSLASSSAGTFTNPRMYHVHVTATSSEYVVAIPRLDADGYTESSADNAKLVSPSFMIASQLGGVNNNSSWGGSSELPGGIEQAKKHCEQYVEATETAVYDDWRLPTAAEIDIIIAHQDISNAMDVVLSGTRYYCAYNTDGSGKVIYTKETGKPASRSSHVRCVRDAY